MHRTIHGIDLYAPGGLEALFDHHRARFGDLQMMADPPTGDSAPAVGDGSTVPPAPSGSQTPAPPVGPAPAGNAGTGDQTPKPPEKVSELPQWAQNLIANTRKEAGDSRTAKTAAEQKNDELLQGIAKALGLTQDEPPDPAKLQQTIADRDSRVTALEADNRAKDVEIAAWRSAARNGANAAALLDSRTFLAGVDKLDPSQGDFTEQLDAAVRQAVKDNPALAATQAATAGQAGIGATGSTGDPDAAPGIPMLAQAYAESPHK